MHSKDKTQEKTQEGGLFYHSRYPTSQIPFGLLPHKLNIYDRPHIQTPQVPVRINFYNPVTGKIGPSFTNTPHIGQNIFGPSFTNTPHIGQNIFGPAFTQSSCMNNIITEIVNINGINYELTGTLEQIRMKKIQLSQSNDCSQNIFTNIVKSQLSSPDHYINVYDLSNKWYEHYKTTINFSEAPYIHRNFKQYVLDNHKNVLQDTITMNIWTGSGVFIYGIYNGQHHAIVFKDVKNNTYNDPGGNISDRMNNYNLDAILPTTAKDELYEETRTMFKLNTDSGILNKVLPHIDIKDNSGHDNTFYRVYLVNLGDLNNQKIDKIITAYNNNQNKMTFSISQGNNSYGDKYNETDSIALVNIHNISSTQHSSTKIVSDYKGNTITINKRLFDIINNIVPLNVLSKLKVRDMHDDSSGGFMRYLIN